MFGTDYPCVSTENNLTELRARHLSSGQLRAMVLGNALRVLPQHAT